MHEGIFVCIHGLGGSADDWAQFVQLAGPENVITVEIPALISTGAEQHGEPLAAALALIGAACERAGAGCWLAGHSLGALLAVIYALEHPGAVRGLLLVSTPLLFRQVQPLVRLAITAPFPQLAMWTFHLKRHLFNYPRTVPYCRSLKGLRRLWRTSGATLELMREAFGRFGELLQGSARLTVPTVLVHGTRDWLIAPPPTDLVKQLAPSAEMITLAGTHDLLYEVSADVVSCAQRLVD